MSTALCHERKRADCLSFSCSLDMEAPVFSIALESIPAETGRSALGCHSRSSTPTGRSAS
eukprot:3684792-Lingulodinium_polyedra.AAC.1